MGNEIWTINAEGTPCFAGTHVPVKLLLDHLERGFTIYEFLRGFPTVRRRQVIEFLEIAADAAVARAPMGNSLEVQTTWVSAPDSTLLS